MTEKPVIVIGDGWAALGAVGMLATQGVQVRWIAGTGSRILAPLPTVEEGSASASWRELAEKLGVECGTEQSGSFLREFKNKAFREPNWAKVPVDERRELCWGSLWAPERRLANLTENRFEYTLAELEEKIRAKLVSTEFENLRRIEGIPVTGLTIEKGRVLGVVLGSGEQIECERVIYADRWNYLPKIQNLPKGLGFVRKRDPAGVLQATFTHSGPIAVGVLESFFGALYRDSGEQFDRHVWGYFSSDGMRSFWTVCLAAEEVEDNHEIGKKLRKMKSSLDRMFTGSAWLPVGADPDSTFMSHVRDEHVRFEEAWVFAAGEALSEPIRLPQLEGIEFLTDGYGPSSALTQGSLFSALERTDTQGKNMDAQSTAQL